MPVISSRRYSSGTSSYLTPSTTSSVGNYRSTNYSSSLSTSTTPSPSLSSTGTSSRYNNYGTDTTYRSSYRSGLASSSIGTGTTTSSYRSRYDFDDSSKDLKKSSAATSSLSTRIGVSKTSSSSSRFNSDTLPPLPPTASSSVSSAINNNHHTFTTKRSLSRSRDQTDSGIGSLASDKGTNGTSDTRSSSTGRSTSSALNDLDFYEKYSPSRYMTKFELSRSRSLSEAAATPETPHETPSTPTLMSKREVCFNSSNRIELFRRRLLLQQKKKKKKNYFWLYLISLFGWKLTL